MKRLAKNIARIVVVVFPVAVGLFLTSLGAVELHYATVISVPKWSAPYGFLLFASLEAELSEWSAWLDEISVDDNSGVMKLLVFFSPKNFSSLGEVVFGFQVPYSAEVRDAKAGGWDNNWREVPLEVSDNKAMAVGNNTSLVYLNFVASAEATFYWVSFEFYWKGFMVREGFSGYSIIFPISLFEGIHNAVNELFPNSYTYYGESLGKTGVGISLPDGIEVKRVHPLPEVEVSQLGQEERFLSWEFTIPEIERWWKRLGPSLMTITVSFEVRQKAELRNRLLFDSGLYMGLGIGLLISGLHEALKYMMEIRKRTAIS